MAFLQQISGHFRRIMVNVMVLDAHRPRLKKCRDWEKTRALHRGIFQIPSGSGYVRKIVRMLEIKDQVVSSFTWKWNKIIPKMAVK